jgi:hypothetical protein
MCREVLFAASLRESFICPGQALRPGFGLFLSEDGHGLWILPCDPLEKE